MAKRTWWLFCRCLACALLVSSGFLWLWAQQTERPGNSRDDRHKMACDLSGLSLKNPRCRVVHTTDPSKEGGSMYLQQEDPWLGYEWGRSLTQRNFTAKQGVYGNAGELAGPLLPDGFSRMQDTGHTSSCGLCHNVPYRDAGAGATIPFNGGSGPQHAATCLAAGSWR